MGRDQLIQGSERSQNRFIYHDTELRKHADKSLTLCICPHITHNKYVCSFHKRTINNIWHPVHLYDNSIWKGSVRHNRRGNPGRRWHGPRHVTIVSRSQLFVRGGARASLWSTSLRLVYSVSLRHFLWFPTEGQGDEAFINTTWIHPDVNSLLISYTGNMYFLINISRFSLPQNS